MSFSKASEIVLGMWREPRDDIRKNSLVMSVPRLVHTVCAQPVFQPFLILPRQQGLQTALSALVRTSRSKFSLPSLRLGALRRDRSVPRAQPPVPGTL